jgi:phosphoribosyl 1,2-cyclic phosphodiesterase
MVRVRLVAVTSATIAVNYGGVVKLTFFGVRGSTPCSSERTARYGGHTSCVVVKPESGNPIICDLGTGLRNWGETQPHDGTFAATALVTHFHFDHVQGLPFLSAADRPGARLDIYGPTDGGQSVREMFTQFVRPPFFPVTIDQLRGTYNCHDAAESIFAVEDAKIMSRPVPHVGLTLGYRIDVDGKSIAYIPDHQAPDDMTTVDPMVRELVEGVDLLIHDAQYDDTDWPTKSTWGHSTIDYALTVAKTCGARALALFHHDPCRTDDVLDGITRQTASKAREWDIEVFAAREGLTIDMTRPLRESLCSSGREMGPMFARRASVL